MSLLRLKDVANYVRTRKATAILLNILRKATHIFNFTEERHNRISRYLAVINAYKRGDPIAKIEADFGCTKRTIYDYVKAAGLKPRSFVASDVKSQILHDYQLKIPIQKICELHGVSARYVHKVARDAGLRRYKKAGEQKCEDQPTSRS